MQELHKAGKYEILHRIGEGGFGVVYAGRDPFIKRTVAIKTCTSSNEETRRRFLREAEIAGNVVHPNITLIYDFGFEGEVPYLVQEFLTGEDLGAKVARRETIPLTTKLHYLLQIAQGLGFAHEQGITHRDIKPGNIRILEDGRVKIMDFGIAKLSSGGTQLTQTGTTLGTPAYLSPEQLRGDDVDPRSDIYSFGALTHELLTYKRPFDADTISALFFQILHQTPGPLSADWSNCPPELDDMIQRCLNKDPEERVQSFREVIAVLRRVIEKVEQDLEAYEMEPQVEEQPLDEDDGETARQQAIQARRSEIEELMTSGSFEDAAGHIETALGDFGDLVPFRTLQERLVRMVAAEEAAEAEQSHELLDAVDRIRRLLDDNLLEDASVALAEVRDRFPEGPLLIAAGRQLRLHTKLRDAEKALDEGKLEAAEAAAQRAQELDPDAPELPDLLRRIEERRAAAPRSTADLRTQSEPADEPPAVPPIAQPPSAPLVPPVAEVEVPRAPEITKTTKTTKTTEDDDQEAAAAPPPAPEQDRIEASAPVAQLPVEEPPHAPTVREEHPPSPAAEPGEKRAREIETEADIEPPPPRSEPERHLTPTSLEASPEDETVLTPKPELPPPAPDTEEEAAAEPGPEPDTVITPVPEVEESPTPPTESWRSVDVERELGRVAAQARPDRVPRSFWIIAGVVGVVALLLLLSWLGGRGDEVPGEGTLVLDARPWAEITAIVNTDGVDVLPFLGLGSRPSTPIALSLPAGDYRLTLTLPRGSRAETIEITVGEGEVASRRVELGEIDVDRYFEETAP